MFTGLGEEWATRTLTVKTYPGCAYIDSTVDSLLRMGPLAADDVKEIVIDAGLLTCGMEAWSSAGRTQDQVPTPVEVNFSAVYSAAVTVLAGRLTPHEMRETWLSEHRTELNKLAARIRLQHDWDLTREGAAGMANILAPAALRKDAGTRRLLAGLRKMAKDHRSIRLGVSDAADILKWLRAEMRDSGDTPKQFWSPGSTDGFQMRLPARVRVTMQDGRVLHEETLIPEGAAGHETVGPLDCARTRFENWGPALWGGRAEKIAAAVNHDADDLADLVLADN
jgi:hypothetical protein